MPLRNPEYISERVIINEMFIYCTCTVFMLLSSPFQGARGMTNVAGLTSSLGKKKLVHHESLFKIGSKWSCREKRADNNIIDKEPIKRAHNIINDR